MGQVTINTRRRAVRYGITALMVLGVLGISVPTTVAAPSAKSEAGGGSVVASMKNCVANNDRRDFRDFERLVGKQMNCSLVFSDVSPTWATWVEPWFAREPKAEPQYHWARWVRDSGGANHLVITHSLIPDNAPPDWRARGAAGEYDEYARQLSRFLVGKGLGSSTIRLAHEANGDWFRHHVGDTKTQRRQWAQHWARTVRAMREVPGAEFRFDLSVNAAYRPIDIDEYYPGDDVVDIIGISQYDSLPSPKLPAGPVRWSALINQRWGTETVAAYAKLRGKPFSVGEYGLFAASKPSGAGDNPFYIRSLARYVQDRPTEYVAYFNSLSPGNYRLVQAPRSLEAWKQSFGRLG